ncbi:sigma-54-dependent transcriptional regulator [Labilibacter marinus]|uniref:sigma-54-dependent transcriptional regulator n=1 Tax=Labilibacter marinus TaxID=1477105 RepID=UPI0008343361|nr:sigma-54 dependent transcriptional regulator [Labilibacter marinus]
MKILVVDDDELSRFSIEQFLAEHLSYEVITANDGESAIQVFKQNPVPVVITDMKMPGISGIKLLQVIKEMAPETEVIILTGFGDMQSSIEALRSGACDYILKPVNIEQLALTLERIENYQKLRKENHQLKDSIEDSNEKIKTSEAKLHSLHTTLEQFRHSSNIGVFSSVMRNIVSLCDNYHKERDVPILIQGDTGTGKEVLAQIVHNNSREVSDRPFIPVNCAAIPTHLFESELFGYEEGAFTGARKNGGIGKLELAQGGTIFMDEIGEMPLEFQPKLLRALQEREIYRIGGDKLIQLDVRFIFATNRNLSQLVHKNEFRSDLFYRLNVGQISIPPLCERKDEIIPLAQMFLERFAHKRKKAFQFIEEEARHILCNYEWPGNVRELQNVIERAVLLYNDEMLRGQHLLYLLEDRPDIQPTSGGYLLKSGSIILPEENISIEDLESEIVSKALKMFDGNKTKVADYLGISRSALRSRLRKL